MKIHKDLELFKQQCIALDLCKEYTARWNSVQSDFELVQMATDINGMPYLIDSLNDDKTILKKDFVVKNFSLYVNNDKEISQGEYNSKLFLDTKIDIRSDSTIYGLCGCTGKVNVPRGHVCHVYKDCKIKFTGKGKVYVHDYIQGFWNDTVINLSNEKDYEKYLEITNQWYK